MQIDLSGIDWTAAAVVAAVIAGAFTLTKEIVTFLLDLLKQRLQRRRDRSRLLGRMAHHYFQMGVGTSKALNAWAETERQIRGHGFDQVPNPPAVDFLLRYDDAKTGVDVVDLADQSPEIVSQYLHVTQLRAVVKNVYNYEEEEFGDARMGFTFPRTRQLLRAVLESATTGLDNVSKQFPRRFILPSRGPRAKYRNAAEYFRHQLTQIPPIEQRQIVSESMAASEYLAIRRVDSVSQSKQIASEGPVPPYESAAGGSRPGNVRPQE